MDHIEQRRAQWARELPDVDTSGMALLGRTRWITLRSRPHIEGVFERHGLDTGTFDVLTTLMRAGPPYRLRPTELFTSLMVSSGGLTDRLDRLVKAKLVRRVRNEADARSLMVELTNKGRTLTEVAFREDMAVELELLKGLSSRERDQLASLLAKLATSMAG